VRRHWRRYKPGDERTREFFAWWPVTIRQEHAAETRWLETVRVLERWTEFKAGEKFWPQRFFDESNSNAGERTPPALTAEERDSLKFAINQMKYIHADSAAATLRALLERTK
jgi:hypothetical protein